MLNYAQYLPFSIYDFPYKDNLYINKLQSTHRIKANLKGVCKEIMVEHRPILATYVHNHFAEFVTDEIGHRFVLGK